MIEVRGKKYQVLEILKKSQFPEQDLYVCMSEYGYRECFLGFDITYPKVDRIHERSRAWTIEEKEYVSEMLKQGHTVREIKENFINPRRTEIAIEHTAYRLKEEMNQ